MTVRVRRPDGGEDRYDDAPPQTFFHDVRDDGRLLVLARVPEAADQRVAEYSRYGWHRVDRG